MKHINSWFYQAPINNEVVKAPVSVAQGSIDDIEDGATNHGKKTSSWDKIWIILYLDSV